MSEDDDAVAVEGVRGGERGVVIRCPSIASALTLTLARRLPSYSTALRWLSDNNLDGTIPSEVGLLTSLEVL